MDMNYSEPRPTSAPETEVSVRGALWVALVQVVVMAAVVVGGMVLLNAAGVHAPVVDEFPSFPAPAEPVPERGREGGIPRRAADVAAFECRMVPEARCACSGPDGSVLSVRELLAASGGVVAPGVQARWRRQCGVTTDVDTAP